MIGSQTTDTPAPCIALLEYLAACPDSEAQVDCDLPADFQSDDILDLCEAADWIGCLRHSWGDRDRIWLALKGRALLAARRLQAMATPARESDAAETPHAGVGAGLPQCVRRAYEQFKRATEERPDLETDNQVHGWLLEHEDDVAGNAASFKRYIGMARRHYGTHKKPRHLGVHTRSVVDRSQVEAREND